jgi:transposase
MPAAKIAQQLLLPELELLKFYRFSNSSQTFVVQKKRPAFEVCPKCAKPSNSYYDKRWVKVRDNPLRGIDTFMRILKRRYYCKGCRKPFTEPVSGIMPKRRTTQRYRRGVLWACQKFSDLKSVRHAYRCSSSLLYTVLYEQLELKQREKQNPWPKKIGIDEHFFSRSKGYTEYATIVTDMTNKRVKELVLGKAISQITPQLEHIEGRENVREIVCDLADTYRSFAKTFFPNAIVVADKFHVLRLLTHHIMRKRREITGSNANRKARKLLLMSAKKLDYFDRRAILEYLKDYPELAELYHWKERLHGLYRTHGYQRAAIAFDHMILDMTLAKTKEVKTLRTTLLRWREEILNYFRTRLTNARTEGFNNIAKLVQKRAFGYKSFRNYRLRLLSACG